MKKIALTIVCALTTAGAAFAQGTVTWATPANSITAETNATTYSPLFGGGAAGGPTGITVSSTAGTYDYALLYATAGIIASSSTNFAALFQSSDWTFSGLTATNSSTANRLSPVGGSTTATVPWANGTTDSVVLVGWSANLGSSWGVVSNLLATQTYGANSYFGVSSTGFINPNLSPANGAAIFNTAATGINGVPIDDLNMQLFLLPPVPEPATMALAGLSGLALVLFRRRK
jgi:hypothetical protein